MLDDRNERVGVKFSERDLLGIPLRITVGRDIKDGKIEYSMRKNKDLKVLVDIEDIVKMIKKDIEKEEK